MLLADLPYGHREFPFYHSLEDLRRFSHSGVQGLGFQGLGFRVLVDSWQTVLWGGGGGFQGLRGSGILMY